MMKSNFWKIIVAQVLSVFALALVLTVVLWKKEPKDISLDVIRSSYTEQYKDSKLEEMGSMRVMRNFNLNTSEYQEFLYYSNLDTMNVDELLVIKLENQNQASAAMEGLQYRLDTQKKAFDGYGTNQTDLLNHAILKTDGIYVYYLVSEDVTNMHEMIKECLGE